ncbi:YrdB family protein [Humidisolicoccus flavus]|uniref:YrdB family protein n=1 Tax=Humidisolicoccus flavus TaxID=3111414 RepID=UPI00324A29BD
MASTNSPADPANRRSSGATGGHTPGATYPFRGIKLLMFAMELGALVAIAWAAGVFAPPSFEILFGVAAAVIAGLIWTTFRAPKRLWTGAPIWARSTAEFVVMGAATGALLALQLGTTAALFLGVSVWLGMLRYRDDKAAETAAAKASGQRSNRQSRPSTNPSTNPGAKPGPNRSSAKSRKKKRR